nr:MAG: polyprotein [Actinidia virus 1]
MRIVRAPKGCARKVVSSGATKLGLKGECSKNLPRGWGAMGYLSTPVFFGAEDPESTFVRGCSRILDCFGLNCPKAVFYGPEPATPAYLKAAAIRAKMAETARPFGSRVASRQAAKAADLFRARQLRGAKVRAEPVLKKRKVGPAFKPAAVEASAPAFVRVAAPTVPVVVPTSFPVAYVRRGSQSLPQGALIFQARKPANRTIGFCAAKRRQTTTRLSVGGWTVTLRTEEGVVTDEALLHLVKGYHFEAFLPMRLLARYGARLTPTLDYGWVRYDRNGYQSRLMMLPYLWEVLQLNKRGECGPKLRAYIESFQDNSGYCYLKLFRMANIAIGRSARRVGHVCSALGSFPSTHAVKMCLYRRYSCIPDFSVGYKAVGGRGHMTTTPAVKVSSLPDLAWGCDTLMFGSIRAVIPPVQKAVVAKPAATAGMVSQVAPPKLAVAQGSPCTAAVTSAVKDIVLSKSARRRQRKRSAAAKVVSAVPASERGTLKVLEVDAARPKPVAESVPVKAATPAPRIHQFIKPVFRDIKQYGSRLRNWFSKVNPNHRVKDRLTALLSADGTGYNYNGGGHKPDRRSAVLLKELSSILKMNLDWVKHVLVQKYRPGSKIGAHKDNEPCYYPLSTFRLVTVNVFGEALFTLVRGAEKYNISLDGPSMFEIDPNVNFNFTHSVEVGKFYRGSITLRGHKQSSVLGDATPKRSNDLSLVSTKTVGTETSQSGTKPIVPSVKNFIPTVPQVKGSATGSTTSSAVVAPKAIARSPAVIGRPVVATKRATTGQGIAASATPTVDHGVFLKALTECYSVGEPYDRVKFKDYNPVCQKSEYGMVHVFFKGNLIKKGTFRRYYDLKALRQLGYVTNNLKAYLSSFRDSNGYCYLTYIRAVAMYFGLAESECAAATRALGRWPRAGDVLDYIIRKYKVCPPIKVGYSHVTNLAVHATLEPVFLLANMRKNLVVGGRLAASVSSRGITVGAIQCPIRNPAGINAEFEHQVEVPSTDRGAARRTRLTNVGLDVNTRVIRPVCSIKRKILTNELNNNGRQVAALVTGVSRNSESLDSNSPRGEPVLIASSSKEYSLLAGELVDRILDFDQTQLSLNIERFKNFDVRCVRSRPGLVRVYYRDRLIRTLIAQRYWDINLLRSFGIVARSLNNYLRRFGDCDGYCYMKLLRLCSIYYAKPMSYVNSARLELGCWPSSSSVKAYIRRKFNGIPFILVSLSRGKYAHVGLLPRISLRLIPGGIKLGGHVEADVSLRRMTEANRLYQQVERAQLKDSTLLRAVENTLIEEHTMEHLLQKSKTVMNINVGLNDRQQSALVKSFPELKLKFVPMVHSLHPMSTAVRMCFNSLYARKFKGTKYIDIGGDLKYHVMNGNDVHICNPILDPKDGVRYVNRVCEWNNVKKADLKAMAYGSQHVSCCYSPAKVCKVSCSTAVAVEVYDISLVEMATIMSARAIDRVYLTMMIPGELFDDNNEHVCIPDHGIVVVQDGDNLIYNMPAGQSYCHDRSSVLSYINNPYMLHDNQLFHSEIVGYRCGVCEFRVTRVPVYPAVDTIVHVTVPRATSGLVELHLPNIDKHSDVLSFSNSTSVMIDYEFFTRALTHIINVCTNVTEKTFEYTMTWLRNNSARVVISGRIIHTNVKLAPEHLGKVAALLLTAGVKTRWESGRYARRLYRAVGQETLWESIKAAIDDSASTIKASAYEIAKKALTSSFPFLGDLQTRSVEEFFTVLGESSTIKRPVRFPCSGGYIVGETRYISEAMDNLLADAIKSDVLSEMAEIVEESTSVDTSGKGQDNYIPPNKRAGKSAGIIRDKVRAVAGMTDLCDGSKPGQGAGSDSCGSSLFVVILKAIGRYIVLTVSRFREILLRLTSPFPSVQTVLLPVFDLWEGLLGGDADVWVTYGATVVYTMVRSVVYLALGHSPFGVCLGLLAVIVTPIPRMFITDRDNLACDTLFEAAKGAYFSVPLTGNKWVNRVLSVLENIGYFKSLIRRTIAVMFEESTAASVVMLVMPGDENIWATQCLVKKAYKWIHEQVLVTLNSVLEAIPGSARKVVASTVADVAGGISSVLATSVAKVTEWFNHQGTTSLPACDDESMADFFSMTEDASLVDDLTSDTPGLRGGGVLNRSFFTSLVKAFINTGLSLLEGVVQAAMYVKDKLYPGSGCRTKKGSELLQELFSNKRSEDEEFALAEIYLQKFFNVDFSDRPGAYGGSVECKSFALAIYKFLKSFKFCRIIALCQAILVFLVMGKNMCMKQYRDTMAVAHHLLAVYKKRHPGLALAKLADVDVDDSKVYRVPTDLFDADEVVRSLSKNCKPNYFSRRNMTVYRVPTAVDYEDKNGLAANLVSAPFDFLMFRDSSEPESISLDFNLIKRMLGWTMTKDLVSRIPIARRLHPSAILMVRKGGYAIFDKHRKPIVYNCPDVGLTPEKMDVIFMRLSGGLLGGGVISWSLVVILRGFFNALERCGIISRHLNIASKAICCTFSPFYRAVVLLRWLFDIAHDWYQEAGGNRNEMEVKCLKPVTKKFVAVPEELKRKYSEAMERKVENIDELAEGLVHQPTDESTDGSSSEISTCNSDGEKYNPKFFNKKSKKPKSKSRAKSVSTVKKAKQHKHSVAERGEASGTAAEAVELSDSVRVFKPIDINDEFKLRMGDVFNRKEYQVAEVIRALDLSTPPVFSHTSDLATNAMNEFVYMHMMDVLNMISSMQKASELLMGGTVDPAMLRGYMVDPKVVILDTSTNMLRGTNMGVKHIKDTQYRFCYDPNEKTVVSLGSYRLKSCSRYVVLHEDLEIFYANKVLQRFEANIKVQKMHYLNDLTVVETPPGGGKTTQLVALFFGLWMKGAAVRVVTANRNSAIEIRRKTCALARQFKVITELQVVRVRQLLEDMVRTADSTIMNVLEAPTEVLLVDEIFLMHLGQLLLNFEILKPNFVIGFGDSKQIGYIPRTDLYCPCYYRIMDIIDDHQIQYRSESYRCPKDVCLLLSELYGRHVEARANKRDKTMTVTTISSMEDVPLIEDAKYLVYTQGEKRDLDAVLRTKGRVPSVYLDPQTVHEAQGNTYKKVCLVRAKPQDDSVFSSQEHHIVALSRHTDSLVYYCISSKYNDDTAMKIERSKVLTALNDNEINEQPIYGAMYESNGGNPASGACRAGSMGWHAIVSFLDEVVPGSTVLSLNDVSEAMSTSDFESCVDEIRLSENMTVGKNPTSTNRQRYRGYQVAGRSG